MNGSMKDQQRQEDSIVILYGRNESQCGYCKRGGETSRSYGVVAEKMSALDYESLMLVGWRRSGTYMYKPIMYETCCALYTIRVEVSKFNANKSQRQLLRRVERYLETGDIHLEPSPSSNNPTNSNKSGKSSNELKQGEKSKDASTSSSSSSSTSSSSPDEGGHKKHSLTVETVRPANDPERFALYKKYQIKIHNDEEEDLTPEKFERFLVDSPLFDPRPPSEIAPGTLPYGTYHQLYRMDGKLIAVGVIDLLPSGLSSVYLFYDPDDRQLVLGKYTALREVQYCQEKGLKYYYMGFYNHKCEKMKYKGDFSPSDLLCPTTLSQWFPLKPYCVMLLDKFDFTPLEPTLAAQREAMGVENTATSKETDDKGGGGGGGTGGGVGGGVQESSKASKPKSKSTHPLAVFAPRHAAGAAAICAVPLKLKSEIAYFNQISKKGQMVLLPLLHEWCQNAGPISSKILLKFD